MTGYTSQQVSTLQSLVANAQSQLNAGNPDGALNYVQQYYAAQTGMRGYATDALSVINNTGLFGNVANQELTDALGATNYAAIRPTLAVNLAVADFGVIQQNPNAVPTEDEIASYHYDVYNALSISPAAFGGSSGAALGADWSEGTLTAAEIDSNLSANKFAQNFNQSQVESALGALTKSGLEVLETYSPGQFTANAAAILSSTALWNHLQSLYDKKFPTTPTDPNVIFQFGSATPRNELTLQDQGNSLQYTYDPQLDDAIINAVDTTTGSNGNPVYDVIGQDATATISGGSVSFATDTSGTLSGSNYSLALASNGNDAPVLEGRSIAVSGDSGNDVVMLSGSGTSATVSGGGAVDLASSTEALTLQTSGSTVSASASLTGETVTGSHDTIDFGSHDTGETIDGTGDTINLTKRGDDSVTIDGTGFDVTGDTVNNGVGLTGTDTSAIVHGGAYIGIFGNDETVTATGTASISVARRIHDLTIYASDADIYVGNYADATIWGQGDYIEHGTGAEISGSYYGTPGSKADSYGNDGSNYGGGGDGSDGGGGSYSSDDFARGAAALKKKPSPAHTSAATSAERAAATSAAVASGASNEGATASSEASSHTSTLTQSDMAEVRARRAAQGAPEAGGAATPKFEGPKWAVSSTKTGGTIAPVVTWSFATGPAGANDPFSGFLSASYKATIEKAFAAWAKASGVTFEEVSDKASSDIRIGWGDLETSSKGILGTTTLTKASGAITSAVIRLEDPSLAAVKTGAKGQEKYAGTGATLYQVALHEIGHALGLADNSDRNSVMFASSSKANRKLDATDIKGIQTLFGTHIAQAQANPSSVASASAIAGVNQLVQAMAAFDPPQAPTSLTSLVSASSAAPTLATPAHH